MAAGADIGRDSIICLLTSKSFEETKFNIYSDDHSLVQAAVINIRRILSIEKNPPIQRVIDAGLVPRLVSLLENDEQPRIQFEAAWALTNIASGTSDDTKVVFDSNACPHFVRLLRSESEDIREQCAWALGNIAGDNLQNREMVLSLGCLPALVAILNDETSRISTIRNSSWTLCNLLRDKPAPSMENILQILPCLTRMIFSDDKEIVSNACWTFSYIICEGVDMTQIILDPEVAPKLVKLLASGDVSVPFPVFQTIITIISSNCAQTEYIIRLVLPAISILLNNRSKSTKKEAWRALSIISAGTKDNIQAVIDCATIFPRIIALSENGSFFKNEALRVISFAFEGGTDNQILEIAKDGAIPLMCTELSCSHEDKMRVVNGLDRMLKVVRTNNEAAMEIFEVLYATFDNPTKQTLCESWDSNNICFSERSADMMWQYSYKEEMHGIDRVYRYKRQLLSWILAMEDLSICQYVAFSSIIDLYEYM